MNKSAKKQMEQIPFETSGRPRSTFGAHLISAVVVVYLIGCVGEFVFITRVFGPKNAMVLSLVAVWVLILGVSMRCR
jgi:hypothetical protein